MPLTAAEFARRLLKEAHETHPWLHHPVFRQIYDGELSREQVRNVIRQQGAFFLDTLRHAAWKIISVGGYTPTWEDLERQRCEALGLTRDEIFATDYLPATIIEKNELFQLQREGTLQALCGGNIATESINPIASQRMAASLEKHYGVPHAALDFDFEHMEVEEDHADRAIKILEKVARTDEEQKRGLLAMRRAITARRICADGMLAAFAGAA